MCLPNFMKFRHCLFKILKNQNVANGRTDGQRENSIPPPQTQFTGWGGGGGGGAITTRIKNMCRTVFMYGNRTLQNRTKLFTTVSC